MWEYIIKMNPIQIYQLVVSRIEATWTWWQVFRQQYSKRPSVTNKNIYFMHRNLVTIFFSPNRPSWSNTEYQKVLKRKLN
jgi:hypothetical protein